MRCLDRSVEYSGASIRVSVETTTESACEEVLRVRDPLELVEVVRRHGGCRVASEDPLKVVSADGEIEVTAEPENLLARAYLGIALERLKRVCETRGRTAPGG